MKKTYFGVEGDAEFDSVDVSGSDSDCQEESDEEVNEPRTTGVWSVVMGEKCSVVVAVVGGQNNRCMVRGHGRKMQCSCGCGRVSEQQVYGAWSWEKNAV